MNNRFFSDETIQKHIAQYGREEYIRIIQEKLKVGEEDYKRKRKKLLHILERIENDFGN